MKNETNNIKLSSYDQDILNIGEKTNIKAGLVGIEHIEAQLPPNNVLRLLLDKLSDGVALFENGVLVYASPAFKKIIGHTDFSIFHRLENTFSYVHPDDLAHVNEARQVSLKHHDEFQKYEFRFRRSDGSYCWIENSIKREYDASGNNNRIYITARDITDRKNVEASLRRSEERFKALFSQNATGLFTIDSTGKIIETNAKFCEISGYSPNEIIQKPALVILHHLDKAFIENIGLLIPNTSKEHPLIKKNESVVWVETHYSTIHLTGVYNDSIIISVQDITWRKEAERAIDAGRKTLEAIVDNTAAIIYTKDMEGSFEFVNKAFERIVGVSARQIIGKKDTDFTNSDLAKKCRENDLQIIKSCKPAVFEESLQLAKNTYTVISVKVPLFNKNGDVSGICGISTDITARKKAEEQLRDLKEKLELALAKGKMGIWEWYIETNLVNWYGSHATLFGINENDFGGTVDDVQNIVHPEDRNRGMEIFTKTITSGAAYNNIYRVIWPDKSIHWLFSYGNLVNDKNGKPWRIVGTTQDITSDKLLKDKMMEQNRELAELNLTKDKLFSIISHDLANPLNSLLGFALLMHKNFKNGSENNMGHYATMILKSANSMADMLKTLTTWSRSQRGKINVEPKMLHPSKIVASAFNIAFTSAHAKQISLINNIPDDITAFADEEMLKTIVRNIISNAVKFSYSQSFITANYTVNKTGFVFIISDNGFQRRFALSMISKTDCIGYTVESVLNPAL